MNLYKSDQQHGLQIWYTEMNSMSCIKVINNMAYKSETWRSTCLTNLKHRDEQHVLYKSDQQHGLQIWNTEMNSMSCIKVINNMAYKSETEMNSMSCIKVINNMA